jgi:ElaB/YqjD/DUF883 family membrane-anchored ribosome-binding protein
MKTTQPEVPNEKLLNEFESVVSEAESLIKSIANASSDKMSGMRANVEQGLAAAGDRLAKIREQAVGQATEAARATDDYVKENPWQAIGLAAAIGALAGLAAGLAIARR